MPIVQKQLVSQYTQIHQTKRYGQTSHAFAQQIRACLQDLKPSVVLEYGCGQSKLNEILDLRGIQWVRYDPAIPELSRIEITRADLVINTDVLEHIPEADVPEVLQNIRSFSENVFFNIATRPAKEILPNGENAHCTVWPTEKWVREIQKYFPRAIAAYSRPGHSCIIITWDSPVRDVISELAAAAAAERKAGGHVFKRLERKVRKAIKGSYQRLKGA